MHRREATTRYAVVVGPEVQRGTEVRVPLEVPTWAGVGDLGTVGVVGGWCATVAPQIRPPCARAPLALVGAQVFSGSTPERQAFPDGSRCKWTAATTSHASTPASRKSS